jgi:peptidylprolyl isomerase
MKYFITILVLVVIVAGLGFLVKKNKTSDQVITDVTSGEITTSVDTNAASTITQPNTPVVTTEETKIKSMEEKKYTQATLVTNLGDITITLDTTNTPKTAENFIKLAEKGFYNGTRFHRVIAGFMIQGGDPLSADTSKKAYWGTGGPGYQFADEIKSTNNNKIGTISMANSGPNTNGSQFFINVANNDFLNPKHTVFGSVSAGMETVNKIALTKVGQNDQPVADVVITKIILK